MNKAPAFQFYAQDFLTGVMYLTNEEIGIYIKMLAKQWTDGKIPKKRLGFLVGLSWDKLSEELQSKFKDMGDYVINERLELERDKKMRFSQKQAENGKKGGRPPKEKTQNKPNPLKNKNPKETQKKPLEDEDRSMKYEEENEIENSNWQISKISQLEIPDGWNQDQFAFAWSSWLNYKNDQFGFKYKTAQSERIAVMELFRLSDGDLNKAGQIISNSIANGWKGLFAPGEKSAKKEDAEPIDFSLI